MTALDVSGDTEEVGKLGHGFTFVDELQEKSP
jgi:hypothetical protein